MSKLAALILTNCKWPTRNEIDFELFIMMLEAISEVRSLIETIGQSVLDEAEEVTAQTVEDVVRKRYEPSVRRPGTIPSKSGKRRLKPIAKRLSRCPADNGQFRCGRGRLKHEAGLGFDHRAQFCKCLPQLADTIQIKLYRVRAIKLEGVRSGTTSRARVESPIMLLTLIGAPHGSLKCA